MSLQTNDFGYEIKGLLDFRKRFPYYSLIGRIDINSIKEKLIPVMEVLPNAPIDILCVDETKLDSSFPDLQFKIQGYQFPSFRRDRNSKSGGKSFYLREGFIVKRIPNFKIEKAELICLEITIAKKSGASYSLTDLQTFKKRGNFSHFQHNFK